jgi:hypothetical protein
MAANQGTCTYCGAQFPRGWCLSKHIRACAAQNAMFSLAGDAATDVPQHDVMSEDNGYDGAENAIAGFANVTQEPQAHHKERYRLNDKHLETLKFLGPMCGGLPVGAEKLKAMLQYAKSLDSARVRFLPKTPGTAWRRLAKVSNNISNWFRST